MALVAAALVLYFVFDVNWNTINFYLKSHAERYLSVMAFSYTGLAEQLEFEGFTPEQAQYAADLCGADWNAQAVKCAENYLKSTPYSRQHLVKLMLADGFTQEQIEYGLQQCGY